MFLLACKHQIRIYIFLYSRNSRNYFLLLKLKWVHHKAAVFFFSQTVSVLTESLSPAYCEFCSFHFQDICIFFTSVLDGNPLSLPFMSPASQYGRAAFFPLSFSTPGERLLSITYPIWTDQLQHLQRSELGVRFMSICTEIWGAHGCSLNFKAARWHSKAGQQEVGRAAVVILWLQVQSFLLKPRKVTLRLGQDACVQ